MLEKAKDESCRQEEKETEKDPLHLLLLFSSKKRQQHFNYASFVRPTSQVPYGVRKAAHGGCFLLSLRFSLPVKVKQKEKREEKKAISLGPSSLAQGDYESHRQSSQPLSLSFCPQRQPAWMALQPLAAFFAPGGCWHVRVCARCCSCSSQKAITMENQ